MVSNVNVRNYRPRQQVFPRARRRTVWRLNLILSREQWKELAIMVTVAVVAGLAITQYSHGQMVDMQARAEQLRALNTTVGNENIRLLAGRAQLASKSKILALASTKLNLFEPEKGQVHRM